MRLDDVRWREETMARQLHDTYALAHHRMGCLAAQSSGHPDSSSSTSFVNPGNDQWLGNTRYGWVTSSAAVGRSAGSLQRNRVSHGNTAPAGVEKAHISKHLYRKSSASSPRETSSGTGGACLVVPSYEEMVMPLACARRRYRGFLDKP